MYLSVMSDTDLIFMSDTDLIFMSDTDLIFVMSDTKKNFLSPVISDGWVSLQIISVRKKDWLYKHNGNKVRNVLQFFAFFMTTVFWVIILQNVSKQ